MRIVPVVLLIASTFLMGSSFVIGKMGLTYFSPLFLTSIRFMLGGFLLFLLVILKMRQWPSREMLWKSVVIGAFQTAGVMACIFISMQFISAGESSILTFTNPLLVLIFSSLLLKERYMPRQWLGVFIGLIGVVIVLSGEYHYNAGTWIGFGSAVFWACATLLVKRWAVGLNMWMLSALQMSFGGLILLILSVSFESITAVWSWESFGIVIWLAIPGSLIQFSLWYSLLSKMEPWKASSYLFLAPVFGVLTGALWLHEPLGGNKLVGGLCVFTGIFLSNYKDFQSNKEINKAA
ncbi:DMT family transporter [Paenibacillus sp. RC67]|uniref:DMT family transporter n=1 Tax=Paenibacillus sp. RC67 TaxID=3039392 RepID=UPI0024AE023B|nr:DMT family transporter [Paenibacillus sp. RC67]